MNKFTKKLIAALMAVMMVCSMLPLAVSATTCNATINFRIIAVYEDDSKYLGYDVDYTNSVRFTLPCQYTTSHSTNANHSVKINGWHPNNIEGWTAKIKSGYEWAGYIKYTQNLKLANVVKPPFGTFNAGSNETTNVSGTGTHEIYLVYKAKAPSAPTGADVKNALAGGVVTIHDNTDVHTDKTYNLIDGSYSAASKVTDKKYTVTVYADKYVSQYSNDTNKSHTLDRAANSATVTLEYQNNKWVPTSTLPITFNVKCDLNAPTFDDVKRLVGEKTLVRVVDSEESWRDHGTKDYKITDVENIYSIDIVSSDDPTAYVVKIGYQPYIDKYSNDVGYSHVYNVDGGAIYLSLAESDPQFRFTLKYKNGEWKLQDDAAFPYICDVICYEPDIPEFVPEDYFDGKRPVGIVDQNTADDHGTEWFGLQASSYELIRNDMTDIPSYELKIDSAEYILDYNIDKPTHTLNNDEPVKSINFTFDKEAGEWKAEKETVTFNVICESAPIIDPPTIDDIQDLNGTVTLTDTTGKHPTEEYSILRDGRFSKSSEHHYDFIIDADTLLSQYNAAHGNHVLDQQYGMYIFCLHYTDNGWHWKGDSYLAGNDLNNCAPRNVELENDAIKLNFDVKCENEEPIIPPFIFFQIVEVHKEWNVPEGTELPESIEVSILRDGEVYETATITAEDNWTYVWNKLPINSVWTVVENVPEGFEAKIEQNGRVYTITNTYTGEIDPDDTTVPEETSDTTVPEDTTSDTTAPEDTTVPEDTTKSEETTAPEDTTKPEETKPTESDTETLAPDTDHETTETPDDDKEPPKTADDSRLYAILCAASAAVAAAMYVVAAKRRRTAR